MHKKTHFIRVVVRLSELIFHRFNTDWVWKSYLKAEWKLDNYERSFMASGDELCLLYGLLYKFESQTVLFKQLKHRSNLTELFKTLKSSSELVCYKRAKKNW